MKRLLIILFVISVVSTLVLVQIFATSAADPVDPSKTEGVEGVVDDSGSVLQEDPGTVTPTDGADFEAGGRPCVPGTERLGVEVDHDPYRRAVPVAIGHEDSPCFGTVTAEDRGIPTGGPQSLSRCGE